MNIILAFIFITLAVVNDFMGHIDHATYDVGMACFVMLFELVERKL